MDEALFQLLHASLFISKDDERLKTYSESSVYVGKPDALLIARDFGDVAQILEECHHKKIPVTFCGSRTNMTGASEPDNGLLIALEKKDRLIDIGVSFHTPMPYAKAEPGIILGDFKKAVENAGYFYPPDPTSYQEAQLGGTVATNATGEDSLLYGPTRKYVRELKILTASGEEKILKRHHLPKMTPKNKAGYFLDGEEIDTFIGSEGTLGLITEVTVDLLNNCPDHFCLLIPFPGFKETLEFVVETLQSKMKPRAMELVGPGAYERFVSQKGVPSFPEGTCSLIYLKQEFLSDAEKEEGLSSWLGWTESFYNRWKISSWSNSIFLGTSAHHQDTIRKWRHFIPATVNENNTKFIQEGGGKISTDWWVPVNSILPHMLWVYEESQKLGVDFLVFAHIGNGHPHWNYLTKTIDEKKRVEAFVEKVCSKAVKEGGGVAGEHGIGKIHHNYLGIQYPQNVIQKMVDLKKKWDPHWILGRGNIFSEKN